MLMVVEELTTCACQMTHSIVLHINQSTIIKFMGQNTNIGVMVFMTRLCPVQCAMRPHARPTS